jgi:hypothetical protein
MIVVLLCLSFFVLVLLLLIGPCRRNKLWYVSIAEEENPVWRWVAPAARRLVLLPLPI